MCSDTIPTTQASYGNYRRHGLGQLNTTFDVVIFSGMQMQLIKCNLYNAMHLDPTISPR